MYEWIKANWIYLLFIAGSICFIQFVPTRADRQIKQELTSAYDNTSTAIGYLEGIIDDFTEYQRIFDDLIDGIGTIAESSEQILNSSERFEEGARGIIELVGRYEAELRRYQELDVRSEVLLEDSLRLVEIIKAQNDNSDTNNGGN